MRYQLCTSIGMSCLLLFPGPRGLVNFKISKISIIDHIDILC